MLLHGNGLVGSHVGVQCLCEFRVREWTQEETYASWHAAPPPEQVTAKVRQGQKVLKQELLTTLMARTDNK